MTELKVTSVWLYGDETWLSADIAINDEFIVQRGLDGEYSIPRPDVRVWRDWDDQNYAWETYNATDLAEELKLDDEINDAKQYRGNWI